jgi:hypothetical protein
MQYTDFPDPFKTLLMDWHLRHGLIVRLADVGWHQAQVDLRCIVIQQFKNTRVSTSKTPA